MVYIGVHATKWVVAYLSPGGEWFRGMGELIRVRFAGTGRAEAWVSKTDAAERLSVSTRTVDRWVLDGLPVGVAWRQVGGRRRFLMSEVMLWLDER